MIDKIKVSIVNNCINVEYKDISLHNITPKLYYWGQSYNTLQYSTTSQWEVVEENDKVICCNNGFRLIFYIEDNNLFVKGSYKNITGKKINDVISYEMFNAEWNTTIDNVIVYYPNYYNGTMFNEMQSSVRKERLIDSAYSESADFTVFKDGKNNTVTFGFTSFNEYFSSVIIKGEGCLIASIGIEKKEIEIDEELITDNLMISVSKDNVSTALDKYAKIVAHQMNVNSVKKPLCGFCTWYYYGPNINEKIILRDLEELKKHKELPYKLFQIDDGWFVRRGDFVENEKFSSMKMLAEKITNAGYLPGIWVNPHSADPGSDIYENHKDWFVKNFNDDTPVSSYCLDFSNPSVKKWLYDLFYKLAKEWGYKYIKVDIIATALCAGRYYDPTFNALKNYRESFKIMREAVGEDVYLLACTAPIMASVGIADCVRTSVDIFENYSSLLGVFGRSLNRFYVNNNLFVNDSDCLLIRKQENEDDECFRNCIRNDDEIKTYLTALTATGGSLIQSDKLSLLTKDQFDLLKLLTPLNTTPAIPINFENENIPCSLDFGKRGDFKVVAYINWIDKVKKYQINVIGHIFGFWNKKYYGYNYGLLEIELKPHNCEVFTISDCIDNTPIGVDDSLIPTTTWKYNNDSCVINLTKNGEGVYYYSKKDMSNKAEKVGENIYLVKGKDDLITIKL